MFKRLIQHAPTVVVAACLLGIALAYGGYEVATRGIVAIVIWWAIILGLGLGLLPFRRAPRDAYLSGVLLAGLAVLAALSIIWSASPEKSFLEFNRVTLYLGLLLLAVLAATRESSTRWADGLALGIVLVGLLALTTRFFPGLVPGEEVTSISNARARLAFPLGYWNALGVLLALGYPLLLRSAAASRTAVGRGLAVGVIPALSAAIFLTSSRGAIGAALIGVVVFLVLARPRAAAVWAVACAGAGSVLLVAILRSYRELVVTPFEDLAVTASQGPIVALIALVVCLATGLAFAGGLAAARARGLSPPSVRLGRRARLALGAVAAAALVALVIAADPGARIESFKQTGFESPGNKQPAGQILRGGGGGRYQFWSAAVDQFQANPILGGGAGAYEFWWAAHPRFPYSVRDAHSLWLETLGELGVLGLVLVAGSFGAGLWIALRRLRGAERGERLLLAALCATVLAWAFAAAVDWMWEMTVVSAVAVVCLGLMTGPATAQSPPRPTPGGSRAFSAGVAVIALAWLVICAQASPLLSETRLAESQAAAERGEFASALSAARGARTLQPWAAGPYRQLALVEEERGRYPAARRYITEAIAREPGNHVLWTDAARIERGAGDSASALRSRARAQALDPRLSSSGTP